MTDITMKQALNQAKEELSEHDERMVVDHKQREVDKAEALLEKMKEEMENLLKRSVSDLAMELAMKNNFQVRTISSDEIISIER